MNKNKKFITPEKAASLIPIFISTGISILVIIFFVMPAYIKSNLVNLELNGIIKKKDDLNNLKSQYKIINQKFDKLNNEKLGIIQLISGNSNLDTLLANLGEIGKKNNIEFVSIIPQKVMIFDNEIPDKTKENLDKKNDPLFVEGTKKYLINCTLNAEFNNLLTFLRELEFQENIILLDDLNLKLIEKNSNNKKINTSQDILEVKLSMTFYGRI